jgi:broad specificity polyphosphatase/5'/3'-nucleotidase SurE
MATCKLCHAARLETEPELVQTICALCASKLGTTTMPPPRRPDVPCSRCKGTRFIRVFPRERFVVDAASKWLGADFGCPEPHPDTDEFALRENYITLTPLQFDLTDHAKLAELQQHTWVI